MTKTKITAAWYCQECGRPFKTVKAAEKATSVGCPGCGGVDIDLGKPKATETPKP